MNTKKHKKIIYAFVILLVVAGAVFSSLYFEEEEEKFVKVSGMVIEPLTRTPVPDVDLTVGDTSIRTSESGRFVFTSVGTKTGIRLTHPELLRTIVRLPETRADEQELEVLFNVPLLNALITIIDFEARGSVDAVYEYLVGDIQEVLSREDFAGIHEPIFEEDDITNQEIVIRRTHHTRDYHAREYDRRFREVFEFEVINGSKSKWIRLVEIKEKGSSEWKLIY